MGLEGEDRVNTTVGSRVGSDILKEVDFRPVSSRSVALLLNDRDRCVVTVTKSCS